MAKFSCPLKSTVKSENYVIFFKGCQEPVDYTHAKQNLNEIIGKIPKKYNKRDKIEKKWKKLLWEGDIDGIYLSICNILKGKKKKEGIKKWRNYFHKNKIRMQYQHFRANHILCGSGCVESAIRRVIN